MKNETHKFQSKNLLGFCLALAFWGSFQMSSISIAKTPSDTIFMTWVVGNAADKQFQIAGGGENLDDCWIDWGDGNNSVEALTTSLATVRHTYVTEGTYRVKIYSVRPEVRLTAFDCSLWHEGTGEYVNNGVTSLDVSGCTALTHLDCRFNRLTSLNVSQNKDLKVLICYSNLLTTLNVSKHTALERLHCSYNRLTALDVSGCTALWYLQVNGNELKSVDVSGHAVLRYLWCAQNELVSVNVSGCTALRYLACGDNRLSSLNLSSCTALTYLDCKNNQLSSLKVSRLEALETLWCQGNRLETLDVSACSALERLHCEDNRIALLKVSGLTDLDWLYAQQNRLPLSEIGSVMDIEPEYRAFGIQNIAKTVQVEEVLNLRSEFEVNGVKTDFDFGAIDSDDYDNNKGRLKFHRPGNYQVELMNEGLRNYGTYRLVGEEYEETLLDDYWVSVVYEITVLDKSEYPDDPIDPDDPTDPTDPDDPNQPGGPTANEDLAADEAASAPWAYVQGRTIYLTSDAPGGAGLGEVEAFTAVGRRVYRGHDRAFTVPTAGVYVLRAADGRRCKVMVR